jgi:hypothetical protein
MAIPMRVYVHSGDCEETFRKDNRYRTGQVALHEIHASLLMLVLIAADLLRL